MFFLLINCHIFMKSEIETLSNGTPFSYFPKEQTIFKGTIVCQAAYMRGKSLKGFAQVMMDGH